ncbi:MAG: hypothetical protein WC783_00430 [Candidatus Paceibacterota bacterium]|jgi:hypothetical protein
MTKFVDTVIVAAALLTVWFLMSCTIQTSTPTSPENKLNGKTEIVASIDSNFLEDTEIMRYENDEVICYIVRASDPNSVSCQFKNEMKKCESGSEY